MEEELSLDIDALFTVREVNVVESIDVKGLQAALKRIVGKLQSASAAGIQKDLDGLKRDNAALEEKLTAMALMQVRV